MLGFGKNKNKNKKKTRRRASRDGDRRFAGLVVVGVVARWIVRRGAAYAAVVILVAGVVWSVQQLEASVERKPRYQQPPTIALVDVPDDLESRILGIIDPYVTRAWTDDALCTRVGQALEASAWVSRVRFVRRFADGTVSVSCDYRVPAALLQHGNEYCLIATDGVRLPGIYEYHPSFKVIQGVMSMPPEEGETWPGEDVQAGLDLTRILRSEPFFDQITGILVGNAGGRQNRTAPHLSIATAPGGSRIVWGSAPGHEFEENTIDEKLHLLRENFRRWGRIDATRDYIDISAHRDRFTTR
jgi:hypothetical protein